MAWRRCNFEKNQEFRRERPCSSPCFEKNRYPENVFWRLDEKEIHSKMISPGITTELPLNLFIVRAISSKCKSNFSSSFFFLPFKKKNELEKLDLLLAVMALAL